MNENGFREEGQFGQPYGAPPMGQPFGTPVSMGQPKAKQANLFVMVHRCLRGRYGLAVLIGSLLAAPIAVGAYMGMKPKYESVGLVSVRPNRPQLLAETPENAEIRRFDSYVMEQRQFLMSSRVMDKAVQEPDFLDAGWNAGSLGKRDIYERLSVDLPRGGQVIRVAVENEDPRKAQVAVNAVLKAYNAIFVETEWIDVKSRKDQLQRIVEEREEALSDLKDRIEEITKPYNTDDLETLHDNTLDERTQIERSILMAKSRLNRLKGIDDQEGEGRKIVSIEELAQSDSQLKAMLAQLVQLKQKLEADRAQLGERHRTVRYLKGQVETLQAQVDERAETLNSSLAEGGVVPLPGMLSVDQLDSLIQGFESDLDAKNADLDLLTRNRDRIAGLRKQIAEVAQLRDEAYRTLEYAKIENPTNNTDKDKEDFKGRIEVVQWGDVPFAPSSDKRIPMAAAGALGGMGLGFGIVFLIGFVGGGYRFVEEFDDEGGSANLIGTLPDLSGGGIEEDEMAALSVHHLRNQLQLETRSQPGRGRVLTITSASSGDGKTSLCLSLGMSFAVGGKRTIIVDADLVGRGMTSQLGLRQAEGLVQVIERDSVNGEVTTTPFNGLDVLPAGNGERVEAEHLTQEGFGSIIERLRAQYDTVLIDTGPVLGSLEANIAASISDRVVLAVSRGQNPKLVKASLQRIERVGGVCAGIVFNRARLTDLQRSFSHASVVSQSVRSQPSSKQRGVHTPKALGGEALTRALSSPEHEEPDAS